MKRLFAGVAVLSLVAGYAIAQVPSLFLATPNGTEQIDVRVPSTTNLTQSPQIMTLKLPQVRDSVGYSIQTPVTGFSIQASSTASLLDLTPAGTLAAGTVNFPLSPGDGQVFQVFTSQTITALTLTATGQTIVGGVTTLAANTTVKYVYSASNTTWTRCH